MLNRKLRLTVPMATTEDYPFDFNHCIFELEPGFFNEVRRYAVFVGTNELESVTMFMDPPGFYAEREEDDGLEKVEFQIDRVTLNITGRSVFWSGVVYGKYRDIPWKTHAVPLDVLFKAERHREDLDYRD